MEAAIEQEKDLLPLLLDATPLPSELGAFQWIDFRGTVGANHGSIDSPAAATFSQARHFDGLWRHRQRRRFGTFLLGSGWSHRLRRCFYTTRSCRMNLYPSCPTRLPQAG